MKIRKAKFAGSFYEKNKQSLSKQLELCFLHKEGPGEIITEAKNLENLLGVIVPHAGYMYSGPIAAFSFNEVAKSNINKFILLGPNHSGTGSNFSLWEDGEWETPLGNAVIDKNLATEILQNVNFIKSDFSGHLSEHSLEVQIPFLQFLLGSDFSFVPISILEQNLNKCIELGKCLAKIYKKEKFIVIASTDFTHYETSPEAKRRDNFAIESILNLNAEGLYSQIRKYNITMCGYGPVFALISLAKELQGQAQLLKYSNSGEVSGYSREEVVAYGSIKFYVADEVEK